MPARPAAARLSFLPELEEFARNSASVPYEKLAAHFDDSGWKCRLRETAVTPMPDASVLVTFDVLVGKSMDALEPLDQITMRLPSGPGPVSLIARTNALPTMIHLLLARNPPAPPAPEPVAAPTKQPLTRANGAAAPGAEPPPPYADVATERFDPEAGGIDMIERYEQDGLPILRNPYDIGQPEGSTQDVVRSLLHTVEAWLPKAESLDQFNAFAERNPDVVPYIRDFGDEAAVHALKTMIAKRRTALSRN